MSSIFKYCSPTIVPTSPISPCCSAGESGTLWVWAPTGQLLWSSATVKNTSPAAARRQLDVNANMVHGWPLLSAALTACVLLWG